MNKRTMCQRLSYQRQYTLSYTTPLNHSYHTSTLLPDSPDAQPITSIPFHDTHFFDHLSIYAL